MLGLLLLASEPTGTMTEFVIGKIIGLVMFTGGMYFAGAFRHLKDNN